MKNEHERDVNRKVSSSLSYSIGLGRTNFSVFTIQAKKQARPVRMWVENSDNVKCCIKGLIAEFAPPHLD